MFFFFFVTHFEELSSFPFGRFSIKTCTGEIANGRRC